MSSAILYVAIVVIWACVLIPRWLRRDTSAAVAASAEQAGDEASVAAATEEEPLPEPAPAPRRRGSAASAEERRPVRDEDHRAPADPAHQRVLSARRRLLMMLVVLSIASAVLAGAKMAAWWVIVPPFVMLLGYLLLLRTAAKADSERREMAGYRTARVAGGAVRAPARRPARGTAAAPAALLRPPWLRRRSSLSRRPRSRPRRRSTTSTPTPSCAPSATNWVLALRALAAPRCTSGAPRLGVRRSRCSRADPRDYRGRTFRTCGPRNEMLGWKVNSWSGASRRRG